VSKNIKHRENQRDNGKTHANGIAPIALTKLSPTASQELGTVLEHLGVNLYSPPPIQYVAWAQQVGLFEAIDRIGAASLEEVCACTPLNEDGADALLGVLSSVHLVSRRMDCRYEMTEAAEEYFLSKSPYFIGRELAATRPLPSSYVNERHNFRGRVQNRLRLLLPRVRFGSRKRLRNQHVRNLPACTAAARTGDFADVACLVDIAGGSGTFSIPLALEYPEMRVVLTDLPQALGNIRPILADHNLSSRIELVGLNVLERPWSIPTCDGMFIGNFLHGFDDEACRAICQEARRHLAPGGKLWIHEMLWNTNKNGPLVTALANATLRCISGRQRTAAEVLEILSRAGFVNTYTLPTAMPFSLVLLCY
jgi:acetylserotonin N-methyltransferase